ncbi:hypothetical protein EV191_1011425 [Tamaricihabitans halophyticus]|uniref:Uncharacterized protein n=1 Tax=Tamaricihabitans halophyticus TaxID=1262583 RepID=A0A4R2R6H4_9PSEU|nr:DLW-39 family protein [Tamaricihabitans halophyticus]TCP57469.1 hypothetical protein EV191_1011425 [Tamaricihabitans halophyticus]
MKKLLVLGAVAGAVLFAVKKSKAAQQDDDLWRQATTPGQGGSSANGAAGPGKA